ncbi:MAG TPA: RecX family transcriptional regulator [Anaerolineaceae bacterium]|jgi:regulatory protein|nr:RecX family transcriptional regulator [Anaerolineaceae bacterium]
MKKITAIQAQKRNRRRVNIELDGEYAFSLDRLTAAWLSVDQQLSEDDITRLLDKDEREIAYARVLRYLGFRARSAQELDRFMQQKGFADGTRENIQTRLREEKLLDDGQFSADWIENRSTFRPRSASLLRRELRQKGIHEDTLEQALTAANLDEDALALNAGRRVASRYAGLDWEQFRKKLGDFLLRRGFSFDQIQTTTRLLWAEIGSDKQAHHLMEKRSN